MVEVFLAFLRLGLTSFGGPAAHLGYFRTEFVERRAWLDESQYAQLVSLSQFLPGPASSQVGFALGLLRAGWGGALAAFVAFTLPSAVLLFAFSRLLDYLNSGAGSVILHGLKLLAVAVVAHAVWAMARQLCPDAPRATLTVLAAVLLLLFEPAWMQLAVIAGGAIAGMLLLRDMPIPAVVPLRTPYGARFGIMLLLVFLLLLLGLPLLYAGFDGARLAIFDAFYRAGALVFGGGHVVLPLLEEAVVQPGWVTEEEFLAGYGAAQAVPGPMFAIAAYLGSLLPGSSGGAVGAALAVAGIFLPGFLLLAGVLPLWSALSARPLAGRAVAGVNAAVVGLLGAALYDPLWTGVILEPSDLAIALVGFVLLNVWRLSALYVLVWSIGASLVLAYVF